MEAARELYLVNVLYCATPQWFRVVRLCERQTGSLNEQRVRREREASGANQEAVTEIIRANGGENQIHHQQLI